MRQASLASTRWLGVCTSRCNASARLAMYLATEMNRKSQEKHTKLGKPRDLVIRQAPPCALRGLGTLESKWPPVDGLRLPFLESKPSGNAHCHPRRDKRQKAKAMACNGLQWPAMACYGLLWPAMACYGLLWPAAFLDCQAADTSRKQAKPLRTERPFNSLRNMEPRKVIAPVT